MAVCLSGVRDTQEKVKTEIVKLVRDTVGPVAAFKNVLFVQGLPKTRSGKIPRSSLSNLVNGKPYKVERLSLFLFSLREEELFSFSWE